MVQGMAGLVEGLRKVEGRGGGRGNGRGRRIGGIVLWCVGVISILYIIIVLYVTL